MSVRRQHILFICFTLFQNVAVGQKESLNITSSELTPKKSLGGYPIIRTYSSKDITGTCTVGGEIFSDDIFCSTFYICEGTPPTPVSYKCALDIPYNPETNKCDPKYECNSAVQCTENKQIFPNPNNCASYYICSAALEPVLVYCGEEQFYSEEFGNCRDIVYVRCGERPGCILQGQSFPNYQDCHSYFRCNAMFMPVKYFCIPGQSYDVDSSECVPSAHANCVGTEEHECSTPGQKLPNLDDPTCQTYYICSTSLELDKWSCPHGQQFDSDKLYCRPCELVECKNSREIMANSTYVQ